VIALLASDEALAIAIFSAVSTASEPEFVKNT
jgi:hypothetical protein